MLNLVKLKTNNNINISNSIYNYISPNNIYLPISNTTYRKDDYIYKNELIDNNISSISGKIEDIVKMSFNNKMVDTLVIKNDYKENIKEKNKKIKIKNIDELIILLNKYNLNNITKKINKNIKNIIVSCIDEEIYVFNNYLRLYNNYQDILDTIDLLLDLFNIKNSILAVKSINNDAITNVKSVMGTYPNILLKLVYDRYLISYPKFLCDYLGVLEKESLILNINDIYNIYCIINGIGLNEKLITISGNYLEKSIGVNVKLYTSLKELLDEYYDIVYNDYDIYLNGFIGGNKVVSIEDIIITPKINSIIINKKESFNNINNCINCGACMKICPFNINVKRHYINNKTSKRCIGCGLCNYICPSNIDLKEILWSDKDE